jgi:hypothetical protein
LIRETEPAPFGLLPSDLIEGFVGFGLEQMKGRGELNTVLCRRQHRDRAFGTAKKTMAASAWRSSGGTSFIMGKVATTIS